MFLLFILKIVILRAKKDLIISINCYSIYLDSFQELSSKNIFAKVIKTIDFDAIFNLQFSINFI